MTGEASKEKKKQFNVAHTSQAANASRVQDAGILRATLSGPSSDFLEYVAVRRRVGGTWNACGCVSTHSAS